MSGKYFYGFHVPLNTVVDFANQVKGRVPRASWTDQSKLHVTLLFKGDKCPDAYQDKQDFEQLCLKTPPLLLKVRGLGTFNNRSGPRVLFARVEPQDTLKEWNKALGGKPDLYTAHLTVAKLEDIGDAEPEFINIATENIHQDFGTVMVSELHLYQTQGGGRPYKVAAWHRLCGTIS